MADRLLTPSKITAWLDCAHYLTLHDRLDSGELVVQRGPFSAMARLLLDKGAAHEAACLADYLAQGRSVFTVPSRYRSESFADWVARIGNPLDHGYDVIFQMPLVHDGVRGIADFLVRMDQGDGTVSYEPVDAKLARAGAKPGHVLQLCFYADAVEALTGTRPAHVHIWLGSGRLESIRLSEVHPYWRRLRHQLLELVAPHVDTPTRPEPCEHCAFCEFADHCEAEWRAADSLVYVAGIRSTERAALTEDSVSTLATLASLDRRVEALDPQREARLVTQASLQVVARANPSDPPPFRPIDAATADGPGLGFAALPAPDDGDVFLDYEGHPFWRADRGLFFLFGLLVHDGDGGSSYEARWAHDIAAEAWQTLSLIEYLAERRERYPLMHVYHYNHTERSALERLASDHGVGQKALSQLVDGGLFVDLLAVVRQALVVGTESYGLKSIERLTSFRRNHDIDRGAGAVVEYEAFLADGDATRLARIAAYNEDDVRATLALRDWLIAHRPADTEWRLAFIEPNEDRYPEIDAQVVALHEHELGTPEHLLGDLLGYWRREWRVTLAGMLAKADQQVERRLGDPDVLTGLEIIGLVDRFGAKGKALTPGMRLSFPPQEISSKFHHNGGSTVFDAGDGLIGFATISSIDVTTGELILVWNQANADHGVTPTTIVLNDWVNPNPKPEALSALAADVLVAGSSTTRPVGVALLHRAPPAFVAGHEPTGGIFTDDLTAIGGWAPFLDNSYVAIQGPPGTGKTYTGAHIVLELVRRGQRVGITAMSHDAIDNLLAEVVDVFRSAGESERLHAVRRHHRPHNGGLDGVEYATTPAKCARADYNVVAATTWPFSGQDLRGAPVDVLLIDEAGQLSLADALAASGSARNLILLGDPSQLAQVSQASHPSGAGASVLEHILGDELTIPTDRGVFLTQTRRMHPNVCRFISDQIYGGRLTWHPSCELQGTEHGTGLRWIRAHHAERSTESVEEARLVHAHVEALMGSRWTDASGSNRVLGPQDVLVVAPYNDQVNLLREVFDVDPATEGVRVGTVDKFQGQEAPVVFFTMATSSAAEMPRGSEFLFSKNRLNVAISRARCLAYLVCTDQLLNSRARDVEEMKLIATLCSFVERATELA